MLKTSRNLERRLGRRSRPSSTTRSLRSEPPSPSPLLLPPLSLITLIHISPPLSLKPRFYTPPDSYESKHRFDPDARWTDAEEAAIIRKCDWRVCLFVCVCFSALQLDRGNVSLSPALSFPALPQRRRPAWLRGPQTEPSFLAPLIPEPYLD